MPKRSKRPSPSRLLDVLTDGAPPLFAQNLATWLSSRRFADFAAEHQTKIQKKLRAATTPDDLDDLALELATAHSLLAGSSLRLEYEPAREGRGPDFAVLVGARVVCGVEVSRVRRSTPASDADPLADGRLAAVVARKLGQFLPQAANLLLVGVPGEAPTGEALGTAMLDLQRRAEGGEPALIERNGLRGRGDFFRCYRRLSAVAVRAEARLTFWDNPQAGEPLPKKVRAALARVDAASDRHLKRAQN